jgi:flagellar biosynthetic protein FliO
MTYSIVPSVLALLFVLGSIPVALWVLKQSKGLGNKQAKGNSKNHLALVHRLQVGPREQIAVLQVAGKTLLVGITAHTIQTLADLENVTVEELSAKADFDGTRQPIAFQTLLAKVRKL